MTAENQTPDPTKEVAKATGDMILTSSSANLHVILQPIKAGMTGDHLSLLTPKSVVFNGESQPTSISVPFGTEKGSTPEDPSYKGYFRRGLAPALSVLNEFNTGLKNILRVGQAKDQLEAYRCIAGNLRASIISYLPVIEDVTTCVVHLTPSKPEKVGVDKTYSIDIYLLYRWYGESPEDAMKAVSSVKKLPENLRAANADYSVLLSSQDTLQLFSEEAKNISYSGFTPWVSSSEENPSALPNTKKDRLSLLGFKENETFYMFTLKNS
jgi:hypothetical protein